MDWDGRDVAYIPVSTGSYVDVGMFAIILLIHVVLTDLNEK